MSTLVPRHFNTLPPEMLQIIFRLVPLQSRISSRLVCTLWNEIIIGQFLDVRSLKIFESFRVLSQCYCPLLLKRGLQHDPDLMLNASNSDDIVLGNADQSYEYEDFVRELTRYNNRNIIKPGGQFLVNLFPNIENLVIHFEQKTRIDVNYLVQHYAPQLTTLALFHEDGLDSNDTAFYNITNASINLMTNLRKLHSQAVHFPTNPNPFEHFLFNYDLSLLPKLEHLSLCCLFEKDWMFQFMCESRHNTLKHLSIDELCGERNLLRKLANRNPELANQLLTLSINNFSVPDTLKEGILESICTQFDSLQSLHLRLDDYIAQDELHSIVPLLAHATNLINLSLVLEGSYFDVSVEELAQLPILNSIQKLTLRITDWEVVKMASFERVLFVIFPNARNIMIRAPRQDSVQWKQRYKLMNFAIRNSTIVKVNALERAQEWTPLLGRHSKVFRDEHIAQGDFSFVQFDDEELEEFSEENIKIKNEKDCFLGVPIDVFSLVSDKNLDDIFRGDDQMRKLIAFQEIIKSNPADLNTEDICNTLLGKLCRDISSELDVFSEESVAKIRCIRLLVESFGPKNIEPNAALHISYLITDFIRTTSDMLKSELNNAMDALWSLTCLHKMMGHFTYLLSHVCTFVRLASTDFIGRSICQPPYKFCDDCSMRQLEDLDKFLTERINDSNEWYKVKNSAQLANSRLKIMTEKLEDELGSVSTEVNDSSDDED